MSFTVDSGKILSKYKEYCWGVPTEANSVFSLNSSSTPGLIWVEGKL